MSVPSLPPATFITTYDALCQLVEQLSQETLIALDTESNSMHAYRGRVCLIQLSTREKDYIIDPLAITDMQPLGQLLVAPSIEKIFHAAEYDLICMQRDFGFSIINVFDTMLASRLLGVPHVGLADVLAAHFGVKPDKRHQLDDWGERPLPEESLIYAQMDTHYLPSLRDELRTELVDAHLLEEATEIFRDLQYIDVEEKQFDPDGYWKIGRPRALNRREMTYLREFYLIRDAIAQEEDVPPYKIMSNKAMVKLAQRPPTNFRDLFNMRELSPKYVREYGEDILNAAERGEQGKAPRPPRTPRKDPVMIDRYSALHAWRKGLAEERGIDSSLILPKSLLWQIAEQLPTSRQHLSQITGMGPWRMDRYGEDILAITQHLKG
ncbi:MAG: 3'-5' exonuclease [Anaerolineaceae bacterium]|nr:3'-5' exonuclease [Anaerolineaceae bacterium]